MQARPLQRSRRAALVLVILAGALLAPIGALWLSDTADGAAQEPFPEPAFVTLLNLTGGFRAVDVDQALPDGTTVGVTRLAVQAEEPVTFVHSAAAEPQDLIASCTACHPVSFAVAAGQRIIVLILPGCDPPPVRSDLHVVNESGLRQRGAVRTGSVPGDGRTLLPFDLRDGQSARVGLRLRGGPIDLNLTCPACDPQQIRLGNGIDLEIVIR